MKTQVLGIITAAILVSGAISTSANAMGRKGDPEFNTHMMKMVDANADGKITKEEFMNASTKMAAKEFMMMDMDDNGHISEHEFRMQNR